MNKSEIIEEIATSHDLTKTKAKDIVEQLFNTVGATLKKQGRFSFPGLGTFTVSTRAARKGRNPKTGEPIKIKASNNVRFKASPALKTLVSKVKVAK